MGAPPHIDLIPLTLERGEIFHSANRARRAPPLRRAHRRTAVQRRMLRPISLSLLSDPAL